MDLKSVIFENNSFCGFVFIPGYFGEGRSIEYGFWKKFALPIIKCMGCYSTFAIPGSHRKLALALIKDIFFPLLLEFFRNRLCCLFSCFSQENNIDCQKSGDG